MKTENAANVGKHCFEVAGLGLAPFRFVGMSENVITYPDGTSQAGGSCNYCGTGIRYECVIVSRDGKRSVVGCDCIAKVGDAGLLKAYKTSPEFRAHKRKLAYAKAERVRLELIALIDANRALLATLPHPYGFTDRKTGAPLTRLDSVQWLFDHSGASGRESLLRGLKRTLAELAQAKGANVAPVGAPVDCMPDDSDPSDARTHSLAARDAHDRTQSDIPAPDSAEDLSEPDRD